VNPDSHTPNSGVSPPTIRCLHCDYDLRGLPGDPIRCPECGNYTSWLQFAERHVRRSKAGVYSTWAAMTFPVLCLSMLCSIASPACVLCGLLPMLLMWLMLVRGVRRHAGGSPNWRALFLKHQLAVLPLMLAMLACVPVCVGAVVLVIRLLDATSLPQGMRQLTSAALSTIAVGLVATGFLAIFDCLGNFARGVFDGLNECAPRASRDPHDP
jgi:hypothetical protein